VKAGESKQPQPESTRKRLPGLTVREGFTRHPFDEEFGVKTSGLIAGRHLKNGHRHDKHNTAYYGVAPSVFRSLVKRWRKTRPAAPIAQTSFVDMGAGMGRAVLLASELNFKAVCGVELNAKLAAIARKNVRIWRKACRERAHIELAEGDAVEFALPAGPVVAFLFNPFGAPVLRRLLKAWRKQLAATVTSLDILYVNNEQEGVLESSRGWHRVYLGRVRRSPADAIADHRIMASQPEQEYASANWEDCSIWRFSG